MKKYVNAAESDYIKIGDKVLPRDASKYGYDSYESIAKDTRNRYNKEKEREREAADREKRRQLGQSLYQQCEVAVEKAPSIEDKLQALFDILVPSTGAAETLAGELVRAAMRILYRWYNDGDYFYTGYGLETCGSSAAFIADTIGGDAKETIMEIAEIGSTDNRYESEINDISATVIDYIFSNPETFGTKTEDSREYTSNTLNELEENSYNETYDVDTSGELETYIENDCIDWRDVYDWLCELTDYYGGSVEQVARDCFEIEGLNREQYDGWDEHFFSELDSYISELEQEFPNYGLDDEMESINSATNTCSISVAPSTATKITSAVNDSDIIHSRTWAGLIRALDKAGYSVDSAYRSSPDPWIQAYKDGKSYDIEVTRYHEGDYEIHLDNISEVPKADVYEDDDIISDYKFVASKSVPDSDGFMTDYTWYQCSDGTHVFVFGDNDIYRPEDGYFDHVCDSMREAREWFNSYNGFADDDEDIEDGFKER